MISLASTTLYHLRPGEGSGKTPMHAYDKINEIHGAPPQMPALISRFSFGVQQTPVCFHTPATGRAADFMGGGGGGGGGIASLQATEKLVTLQQPDKKFLCILH